MSITTNTAIWARTSINRAVVASGSWTELDRTTLACAGDVITVNCLADKEFYHILVHEIACGDARGGITFNNDSCMNYAERRNANGGCDNLGTCRANLRLGGDVHDKINSMHVSNRGEHLSIWRSADIVAAGECTVPSRLEGVGKWVSCSQISRVDLTNDQGGSFSACSEVIVLGWDPCDTHTTMCNFWEELVNVELSCASVNIDSCTFTAKKYLWVQAFLDPTTSHNTVVQVGNCTVDTCSNYSWRQSANGAADSTCTNASLALFGLSISVPSFVNMYIQNTSSLEKLFTGEAVGQNTAGAGNPTNRREIANKWDNTSVQINRIDIVPATGCNTLAAGSILKVWGAD